MMFIEKFSETEYSEPEKFVLFALSVQKTELKKKLLEKSLHRITGNDYPSTDIFYIFKKDFNEIFGGK
jgi:hypothetical protein